MRDPGGGEVAAVKLELEVLLAVGCGHGTQRVRQARGPGQGDHVAAIAAGHRQRGEDAARYDAARRCGGHALAADPGVGVGRQRDAIESTVLPGRAQQHARGQLTKIRPAQSHLMQAAREAGAFAAGDEEVAAAAVPQASGAGAAGAERAPPLQALAGCGAQAQLHRRGGDVGHTVEEEAAAVLPGAWFFKRLPALPGQPGFGALARRGAEGHVHGFVLADDARGVWLHGAEVDHQTIDGQRRRRWCWGFALDLQTHLRGLALGRGGFDVDAVHAQRQRNAVSHEDAAAVHRHGLAVDAHTVARHGAAKQVDERASGAAAGGVGRQQRQVLRPAGACGQHQRCRTRDTLHQGAARISVLLPNRLSIKSTASSAVLLRTSSAGLSSITSSEARRPLSAIISMHSCASR